MWKRSWQGSGHRATPWKQFGCLFVCDQPNRKKSIFHLSLTCRLFAFEDETIQPHGNVGKYIFRGLFCCLVFLTQLKLIWGMSPKVTLATRPSLPLQLRFRMHIYAQIHSVLVPNWIILHQLVYSYRFPERKSRTPSSEKKAPSTGYERNATELQP